ncbi:MAG TPA: RNA polymerase sigma factor [Candidatus Dormibacteraeota bacterium]|nr:RNA polymerase sigma factor [Candidatus Dormibacteraeota bacterium]
MDGPSEEDLIQSARSGDKLAYEQLLRPNLPSAARLARVLLGGPGEAEDAVQEAAIRGWKKLDNLRAGAKFQPWFLGIVVRQVRSIQRDRWWTTIRLPELSSLEPGAQDKALQGEDLRRAISKLPPSQREAVLMHFYLDQRIQDVATSLGLSQAAVKSRINRALRQLRVSVATKDLL